MRTVYLAHSNAKFRDGLARELSARGFLVASHENLEAVLDAAGSAPPLALLVEPALLDHEEFEVGTRLELRAGRAVPILALTHRASPDEMKTLRRHGAGLLSRPIDDIERLATQLRIQTDAAPEEAAVAEPAKSAPSGRGRGKKQPATVEIRETVGSPGGRRRRKQNAEVPPPAEEPAPLEARSLPPEVVAPLPASPTFTPPVASSGSILPFDALPAVEVARPAPPPPAVAPPPPPALAPPPPAIEPPPVTVAPPPVAATPSTSILPVDALPAPNRTDVYFTPSEPPPPGPSSGDYFSKPWASPAPAPAPPRVTTPLAIEDLFAEPQRAPVTEARPVEANFAPALDAEEKTESEARLPSTRPAATAPDLMFADEAEEPTMEADDDRFVDRVSEKTNIQDVSVLAKALEKAERAKPAPRVDVATSFADDEDEETQLAAENSVTQTASPFADREVEPTVQTPAASHPRETSVPGIQRVDGKGPSILVVDDEPAFRGFLRDALAARGYQVHTAINAPNALRFLKGDRGIDLVISDLNMPHMDGFELKHEIDRWIGKDRKMPFIVVTADTTDEKIDIAAKVGASAIVPKPIEDLDAFYAIVEDTLRDAGVDVRGLSRKH